MKLLFDFLPIIAFFVAFKIGGIYVATAVAIAVTILQISVLYFQKKKIDTALWVSGALMLLFGGATIFFHNETFIKWKPTVLYALFACIILLGEVAFHTNIFRKVSGDTLSLPDHVWNSLNRSWMVFFMILAVLNIYVAYSYSTQTWVNFKLFGLFGLLFIFSVAQAMYISRNIE